MRLVGVENHNQFTARTVEVCSSIVTMTVWGKDPRSHHKGATGSNWQPTVSSSMPLPTWTRHPFIYINQQVEQARKLL